MNAELDAVVDGVVELGTEPVYRFQNFKCSRLWERSRPWLVDTPWRVVGCEFYDPSQSHARHSAVAHVYCLVDNREQSRTGESPHFARREPRIRQAVNELVGLRLRRIEAADVDRSFPGSREQR